MKPLREAWVKTVLALSIVALGTHEAKAEILLCDGVERPFATRDAIAALKEELLQNAGPDGLSVLSANVEEILPHISWWGYRVERDDAGVANVQFIQRYDSDGLVPALRQWVSGMKMGGCSFINPSMPEFSIQPKQIDYHANLSGKKRACGDNWAIDLASINGSVSGSLAFRVVPSAPTARFSGKIELMKPNVNIDVEANEILGINVNSVVGQLLSNMINTAGSPFGAAMMPAIGVPAWALSSEIDRELREARGRASDAAVYLDRVRGKVNPGEYNRILAKSQTVVWGFQPDWVMNDDKTLFVGKQDNLSLEIVFMAGVPDFGQVEDTVEGVKETLRHLRAYSASTSVAIVKSGDTWTRIAEEYYGTQFLAAALRASQPGARPPVKLRIGQQILVPPIWKVSIIQNHYVVRPGDTFEGICRRRESAHVQKCVSRILKLNPDIQPRKLPALSVLRLVEDQPLKYPSVPSPH